MDTGECKWMQLDGYRPSCRVEVGRSGCEWIEGDE
jgi:hypothetical protein